MTILFLYVSFWLPLLIFVAAYLWERNKLVPSSRLNVFDGLVLLLDAGFCTGFFWREITGHISQDIWLDEYGFMALLVPMWSTIISLPILIIAAVIRLLIFRKRIEPAG